MAMAFFDKIWRDAARQAAEVLNGRLDRSKLTATADGCLVEASYGEFSRQGGVWELTRFQVSVPGWPKSTGLSLRQGRGPLLFRGRYVVFDDAAWDPYFSVSGTDSDTILLNLTRERRTAIRDWYGHHRDVNPVIRKGQISLEETCLYVDADEIVGTVRQLVELATVLTR